MHKGNIVLKYGEYLFPRSIHIFLAAKLASDVPVTKSEITQ